MAATYTSNLRLTKQGDGDNPNTWGQVLNDGVISLVDDAVAGYAAVSIGSTVSVTLTNNQGSGDQARSAILELTGSVGGSHSAIYVLIPNNSKSYVVRNSVSYASAGADVILRVAGNTGVTITPASNTFVITNGTSVYSVAPDTFPSAITVQAAATFESTVTVSGAATFNSTVSVSGATHLKGAVSIGGAVTVAGASHFASTVTVAGAATFSSTVTIKGGVHVSATVCAATYYGGGSNLTGLPSMPTGAILTWSVTAAPSGYLACDGTAVSRTTYSSLFAVVSSLYGDGNGSSTFNVPDLRGKFQAGYGTALTSVTAGMVISTTIGNTGGTQAVTLATAQIPSHTHTVAVNAAAGGESNIPLGTGHSSGAGTFNTGGTGGGGAHSNIPPVLIVNYVIKT